MIEIDEARLKQQLRDCIAYRNHVGLCKFEDETGSCYDCSWTHALEFVIGSKLYGEWCIEIVAELQPEIDALPHEMWHARPSPWAYRGPPRFS